MKTAILFFGQYREFEKCAPTWEFDKHFECDYYISTWNTSRQKFNYLQPDTPENIHEIVVTEEMIKKIFPNCVCSILDEVSLFKDNTEQDGNAALSRSIRQSKMFFHWKNLQNMLIESKKVYDAVVLVRTDVTGMICNNDSTTENVANNWLSGNLIPKFNENMLYCDSNMVIRADTENKLTYLVNDYLFCGSQKTMNRFLSLIPDMNIEENKYNTWTPHIDLANMLIKENLYVNNLHPFKVRTLVRPNKLEYSGFAPVL